MIATKLAAPRAANNVLAAAAPTMTPFHKQEGALLCTSCSLDRFQKSKPKLKKKKNYYALSLFIDRHGGTDKAFYRKIYGSAAKATVSLPVLHGCVELEQN